MIAVKNLNSRLQETRKQRASKALRRLLATKEKRATVKRRLRSRDKVDLDICDRGCRFRLFQRLRKFLENLSRDLITSIKTKVADSLLKKSRLHSRRWQRAQRNPLESPGAVDIAAHRLPHLREMAKKVQNHLDRLPVIADRVTTLKGLVDRHDDRACRGPGAPAQCK